MIYLVNPRSKCCYNRYLNSVLGRTGPVCSPTASNYEYIVLRLRFAVYCLCSYAAAELVVDLLFGKK